MSQEMSVLSVFDSGRLKDPPPFWILVIKWLMLIPRIATLILLWFAFLITSILSFLAILFTAKFPPNRFDLNMHLASSTWGIGYYSLEEFIYRNWSNINWGSPLELYTTDKHSGRRFPAGRWTIDFLARDTGTNDLVIIQLNRGESSDSTVGQLLRYTSWVREKIAIEGQNVRGIIVVKKDDTAMEYSVRNLPFVEIKTYHVGFQLRLKSVRSLPAEPPIEEQSIAVY